MTGLKLMILKPQKPALCPPLLVGHAPLSLSQSHMDSCVPIGMAHISPRTPFHKFCDV